jgi:type IV pilus assembly protein PilX
MLSTHVQTATHAALPAKRRPGGRLHGARQRGVSLLIALVVLVIMTLAGIELMRSVDTTNIIAGNLGFQQAATHSGDAAIESAITWLQAQSSTSLQVDNTANCAAGYKTSYTPSTEPPANTSTTWPLWWNSNACIWTSPTTDQAGNTWSYTINRMCSAPGAPTNGLNQNCYTSPFAIAAAAGSCNGVAGDICLNASAQVYYRITANISGPRGTRSYVQAIVAI